MTLYLSKLTRNRDAPTMALMPLLNPREPGSAADAHHRLIWSVFADTAERKRDFLWRHDGQGRFYTLSSRQPRSSDLFNPPEIKNLRSGFPGGRPAAVYVAGERHEGSRRS